MVNLEDWDPTKGLSNETGFRAFLTKLKYRFQALLAVFQKPKSNLKPEDFTKVEHL